MSEELLTVTIDGHTFQAPKGMLLVEAARLAGIEIPVYCYHPKMKPVGACRACVVEVEGQRRPIMAACTTTVMPDMVVHTKSENAMAAREGVLEFLLINHPLDCPVCDRGGECDLQDFVLRYGAPTTRFVEEKRHFEKSKQVGQNVLLDRERCIMCQRCARFCDEIAMEEGLVIIERGNRSEIGTFEGRSFDSRFSGNTIELCPVGALTAKTYRFNARPWEQQHYAGVCNHCSCGCNLTVDVRFDEVVRLRSRVNDDIDDGWLYDGCRYQHQDIHSEERLTKPLVRNSDGDLEEASWEKALELATTRLTAEDVQPSIIVGGKQSVEDGHMLLRLGRSVLETPDVVHEFADECPELPKDVKLTGLIKGCDEADLIICLGSDPSVSHPAFELRIKKGLRRKAKLISLGNELAMRGFADFHASGEPRELWDKLVKAVKSQKPPKEGAFRMPAPRPWEAGGSTSEDWKALLANFVGAEKILVVVSGDLAEQDLAGVAEEVDSLGWATGPHGVLHLRTGVNSVGLDQCGLTVVQPVDYKKEWGTFNSKKSQSFAKLCKDGGQVQLVVGCDTLGTHQAKKPKFLIAAATHTNATTEQADVVFPLSSWVESNGVFVSTDGTVQFNRQAIVPQGESVPAWKLAKNLIEKADDEPLELESAREIYLELGVVSESFAGCSYLDFQSPGELHWSYPQQAALGMPRPDLSAIPVQSPDAPMWMPTAPTGSKVEGVARLLHGDTPPAAPGQRNPREIAAMLGLSNGYSQPEAGAEGEEPKEGYLPLRVVSTSSAQPPGPTPSRRHRQLGVARHKSIAVPVSPTLLPEPEPEPEENTEEAGES